MPTTDFAHDDKNWAVFNHRTDPYKAFILTTYLSAAVIIAHKHPSKSPK